MNNSIWEKRERRRWNFHHYCLSERFPLTRLINMSKGGHVDLNSLSRASARLALIHDQIYRRYWGKKLPSSAGTMKAGRQVRSPISLKLHMGSMEVSTGTIPRAQPPSAFAIFAESIICRAFMQQPDTIRCYKKRRKNRRGKKKSKSWLICIIFAKKCTEGIFVFTFQRP